MITPPLPVSSSPCRTAPSLCRTRARSVKPNILISQSIAAPASSYKRWDDLWVRVVIRHEVTLPLSKSRSCDPLLRGSSAGLAQAGCLQVSGNGGQSLGSRSPSNAR